MISDMRFSGNAFIAAGIVWWCLGATFLLQDYQVVPFFARTHCAGYAKYCKKQGIVPDLEDHSYGTWNYYPTES